MSYRPPFLTTPNIFSCIIFTLEGAFGSEQDDLVFCQIAEFFFFLLKTAAAASSAASLLHSSDPLSSTMSNLTNVSNLSNLSNLTNVSSLSNFSSLAQVCGQYSSFPDSLVSSFSISHFNQLTFHYSWEKNSLIGQSKTFSKSNESSLKVGWLQWKELVIVINVFTISASKLWSH